MLEKHRTYEIVYVLIMLLLPFLNLLNGLRILANHGFYEFGTTVEGVSVTMEFWEIIGEIVAPAVITSAATAAATYLIFLRKMASRITEKVTDKLSASLLTKLEPSNSTLSSGHDRINASLEQFWRETGNAQTALTKDVAALVRRNQEHDEAYRSLDVRQKSVVDAVAKLSAFSDLLQNVSEQNVRLKQENERLKRELYLAEQKNRTPRQQRDDYEFEP